MIVQRFVFAIWIAAPVIFLLLALWAALERSSSKKATHPSEHLIAAIFLSVCGLVCFLIHLYVLDWVVAQLPFTLPRNFYLLILWPLMLYLGAKLVGPSREIMIEKAPNLARKRR